jgi:hypothetical protein
MLSLKAASASSNRDFVEVRISGAPLETRDEVAMTGLAIFLAKLKMPVTKIAMGPTKFPTQMTKIATGEA